MIIRGRLGWVFLYPVIAALGGALGSALMFMRRAVPRPVLLLSLLEMMAALLQALWVIGSAPGAGNIFIDIAISFVVAAYLVWFTDRKVGCNLLR